jgi:tRNA-2-methylthio-N6-dimethylallyladenosine synthase
MLRRYSREQYLEVVAKLRRQVPGITFSTDIIVGFPGETDAQFEETLTLVAEAGFDDAYTFQYSPRDGTPAMRMLKDAVPDEVASERMQRLVAAVRAQARRKHLTRMGQSHEVLIERPAKRGGMLGRTRSNLLVLVDVPESARGEYHHVSLTGTTGSTFVGKLERTKLAVLA